MMRALRCSIRLFFYGALLMVSVVRDGYAQKVEGNSLKLLDWRPKSELIVHTTEISYPKFPVIDIHNHLGDLENMETYLKQMDEAGVWITVSLDGHSKDDFYKKHLKSAQLISPARLLVFFAPDWQRIDEPNFGINEAKRLQEAVKFGVKGVKVFKDLGLTVKDKAGKLIAVDDSRLDPIWAMCGQLNIPVMIHASDPKAFFKPIDQFNERYDELAAHPDWSFYGTQISVQR